MAKPLAMIPKARGMFAKRPTMAEYEELMRRRTVTELAALLKKHPYFKNNMATLSVQNPHRGQIEELLSLDVFVKYEALLRYDASSQSFASFYLTECEVKEVLAMLRLLIAGRPEAYLKKTPAYLKGKLRIDLFKIATAKTFEELLEALKGTPYQRVLAKGADESLTNELEFPLLEAMLLKHAYEEIFTLAEKNLAGQELTSVKNLFLQQVELHNLDLLARIKNYYIDVYTPEEIMKLLLPYNLHVKKQELKQLAFAKSVKEFYSVLNNAAGSFYINTTLNMEMEIQSKQIIYTSARRLLHLTSSPSAALAAFICLAKCERENIVNVVEGVRYNLPAERARKMILH